MCKNYIDFNSLDAYPAGDSIFYECLVCGSTIPSLPQHAIACKCRNLILDTDAGRIAVKSTDKIKAFSKTD